MLPDCCPEESIANGEWTRKAFVVLVAYFRYLSNV